MAKLYSDTILTILFSALFVINIFGNLIICYTILRRKLLRTPMNILFVNLSIADMTVALFMSPSFIFSRLFSHPTAEQGVLMCTGTSLTWCGGVVSLCTLLSISIERYYAIVHPYSHKAHLSARKVKLIIILSWLFGILWVIPQMSTRQYSEEKNLCVDNWPESWQIKAYSICWLLIAVVIPLSIMAAMYPKIIIALWFNGGKTVEISQRVRLQNRKRLTKIIITITVVYFCCWSPVMIFNCMASYIPSLSRTDSIWVKIGILMVTLNSSINPLLYSYQSKQLKKHIKITIRRLLCGWGFGKIGTNSGETGQRIFHTNISMLTYKTSCQKKTIETH